MSYTTFIIWFGIAFLVFDPLFYFLTLMKRPDVFDMYSGLVRNLPLSGLYLFIKHIVFKK